MHGVPLGCWAHAGEGGTTLTSETEYRRADVERSLSVLVVDDDVTFLSIVARAFDQVGWSYRLAETGRRALELAQQERFRAVLLDLRLPDVDGLNVLRQIRSRPNPPVVVLISGGGTIRSAVEALKLGAQEFIEKPVAMYDLLDMLAPPPAPDGGDDHVCEPVKAVVDLILVIAHSPRDIRTVADWAHLVHMTAPSVIRRCLRVGVRAKQALDLGRMMRVVLVPTDSRDGLLTFESADQRTLFALLARAGMRVGDLKGLDIRGFLRLQMLISEPLIVSELMRRVSELAQPG